MPDEDNHRTVWDINIWLDKSVYSLSCHTLVLSRNSGDVMSASRPFFILHHYLMALCLPRLLRAPRQLQVNFLFRLHPT